MPHADPHLARVRRVHRLRTTGHSWADTAKALGCSIPTARKLHDEYQERRKARTLWEDIDGGRDVDLYAHPVIQPRRTPAEA